MATQRVLSQGEPPHECGQLATKRGAQPHPGHCLLSPEVGGHLGPWPPVAGQPSHSSEKLSSGKNEVHYINQKGPEIGSDFGYTNFFVVSGPPPPPSCH